MPHDACFQDLHRQAEREALYWRAHQQSTVWDLFLELVALGLVNPEALKFQIDWDTCSQAIQSLAWYLGCFEFPHYENEADCDDRLYELWGSRAFNAPLTWLATMIVRGCTGDAVKIMKVVTESRCLGSLNIEAYDYWLKACKNKSFTPNLDEGKPMGLSNGRRLPPFGFWLLHNIPVENWTDECVGLVRCEYVSKFDNIEYIYKKFFNFPDEVILLAEDQKENLAKNSDSMPPDV
ncbi:MAG: hypothetical protein L6R36_004276 [Xanthoria steineri]|nr:MAG: hypothetical protein L6R36_004276 [Xanthoria steineri]